MKGSKKKINYVYEFHAPTSRVPYAVTLVCCSRSLANIAVELFRGPLRLFYKSLSMTQ